MLFLFFFFDDVVRQRYTTFTVFLPNIVAVFAILSGWAQTKGGKAKPESYFGCGIATVASLAFWGSQGQWRQVLWGVACGFCYGGGMLCYVLERPGPVGQKYWGHHEYMHLLITLGFILNYRGMLEIAETCPTGQF